MFDTKPYTIEKSIPFDQTTTAKGNCHVAVKQPPLDEMIPFKNWVVTYPSDKIPLNPYSGHRADVGNPQTWSDFATANACVQSNPQLMLGFVLTDAPFVCIDLDTYKTTDSAIIANHKEIYDRFKTYSELSPNGGVHIWCKGSIPTGKKYPAQFMEMYSSNRYMTVTGNALNGFPVIEHRQELLNELYTAIEKKTAPVAISAPDDLPETQSDEAVIEAAGNALNGELFKQLYRGEWDGIYKSQSEADLAFVSIAAFYTDSKEQVKRIFYASALGKRKKAHRQDYLFHPAWGIITKAFDQKLPRIELKCQFPTQITSDEPLPIGDGSPPTSGKNCIEMYTVADEDIRRIEWLWDGFLPLGKLTVLAGATGTGKSTISFSMAAIVSGGGAWPDRTQCAPGHVVIYSTEDDVNDTIAPRLKAMNAIAENVHYIRGKRNDMGVLLPFDPAAHIQYLQESIQQRGRTIKLFIIDPITSAITGDMNKSNDVRRGLQSLVDFASKMKCAVLGISHFTKGTKGSDPIERVIGSVAFAAFARVVLVAAKEEDSEQRVFTRAKPNIGLDSGGFTYSIEQSLLHDNIIASRIDWGAMLKGSAREILAIAEGEETGHSSSSQISEARAFLLAELKNGPRMAKELMALAKDQLNISEKTLQRGRDKVGVETFKQGYGGPWFWKLSIKDNNGTKSVLGA